MCSAPQLHDDIKPLSWLLGKWQGTGKGIYPTIDDFNYEETLEFFHVGQSSIQFSSYSVHPVSKQNMHREIGFIKVEPGNTGRLAFMIAQNLGLAGMEEGRYEGQEIETESQTLAQRSFSKLPITKKISRIIRRNGDKLEQIIHMETDKTPMTKHLQITYTKVE